MGAAAVLRDLVTVVRCATCGRTLRRCGHAGTVPPGELAEARIRVLTRERDALREDVARLRAELDVVRGRGW
jgi:hypothetical protein